MTISSGSQKAKPYKSLELESLRFSTTL